MKRVQWLQGMVMTALCSALCADGQSSLGDAMRLRPAVAVHDDAPQPAASVEDALHAMFTGADVVFAGTVTKVEPAGGAVTIRFQVDDGIRGVSTGTSYMLREWDALWADDPDRYRVGERRLMLLHAVSAAGYASPVAGMRGAIRLRGDAVQSVADLRWVATDVAAPRPSSVAAMSLPSSALDGPAAAQDTGAVDGVLISGMLHAWQRAGGVTQ